MLVAPLPALSREDVASCLSDVPGEWLASSGYYSASLLEALTAYLSSQARR